MLKEKIVGLLQTQNKRVKDLCASIDMTDTGLRKVYARDSCEMKTLQKIADFFSVSPSYFFDEEQKVSIVAGNESIVAGRDAKNINSQRVMSDAWAEIAAQRKMTEKAMEQIDRLMGIIEAMQKQN